MTTDQTQDWPYPGARWWKFDFHTRTPASADYGKGQPERRSITPREWLLGFMQAGVDCVAVTDHHSGAWIDRLKDALDGLAEHEDYRPLSLFPGVEITANGDARILAVFDQGAGTEDIATLLGAVDYRGERGASNTAAAASSIDVVEATVKAGAIPIFAHVDQRAEPRAEVLGSDSPLPAGAPEPSRPGSRYTWVKMARPSFEGLRLALLDGRGFSIRRSDEAGPFDPFRVPGHVIEAVEVGDARYMGRGETMRVAFNPWLNALVGGRGTGKSTVIHALRLAARRDRELHDFDEAAEPRSTFESFNRVPAHRLANGGLTERTNIAWVTRKGDIRYRVHWRQDGGGTPVEQQTAGPGWQRSAAQNVTAERFPVRIFSQGQIAALAGQDQRALVEVIDNAAGVAALKRTLDDTTREFGVVRARVRDLDARLARRDDVVEKRDDVDRKLRRFEAAGHKSVLTAYRRRGRQKREVERQLAAAEAAAASIQAHAADLEPDDVPDGLFEKSAEEDREAVEAIDAVAAAIRSAATDLASASARLSAAVASRRGNLAEGIWSVAARRADRDYEQLVEALQAEGVTDPAEYGRLAQTRQRLDVELAELESMRAERARLAAQSDELRQKLVHDRRAISDARRAFLAKALAHNEFVRIRNLQYGDDPQVIERSLRETLDAPDHFAKDILDLEGDRTGWVAELLDDLPAGSGQRAAEMETRIERFKERVCAAAGGDGDFGGHFNRFLERETQRRPELLDRLLAWFPEDGLNVEYSRRGDGKDFQPIAQASAGQRSAAMLAFLLAHGDEPLVLDQPEDDLDNHLIYDLVVRQIRQNKLRRQIIVVTHNPNVVVNGDAEMLHVLDFQDGQCRVVQSGSLQEKAIRDEVCRVMEGGREAFERRYRRLAQQTRHV